MPDAPALDIESFLAPIPGDEPAGRPFPFDAKDKLDFFRKEVRRDDYPADDPARPEEDKRADWAGIVGLAEEVLKERSKDLRVAARLVEGLTRTRGFDGLADGLGVMRGMVEQCWDRLHPEDDPEDREVRAGPFDWLASADSGARFPFAVRAAPVVYDPPAPDRPADRHARNGYSWQDWKASDGAKGRVTKEQFDKAVAAAAPDDCRAVVAALDRSVAELAAIDGLLKGKLGKDAPGMIDLRAAVLDCLALAKQVLAKKAPEAGPEEAAGPAGGGGAAGPAGPAASRAEVYRRLAETADQLERIEPHSPVPHLLRMAVEYGAMPFPVLLKALIQDSGVLTDLHRRLGIREDPPA